MRGVQHLGLVRQFIIDLLYGFGHFLHFAPDALDGRLETLDIILGYLVLESSDDLLLQLRESLYHLGMPRLQSLLQHLDLRPQRVHVLPQLLELTAIEHTPKHTVRTLCLPQELRHESDHLIFLIRLALCNQKRERC